VFLKARALPRAWRFREGSLGCRRWHPMLIVCAEVAVVEARLVGGRLACPSCREALRPWGHARERVLRCRSGDRWLRPRRARCRGCAGTHVLLPDVCLVRRQDEVGVIGAAIVASVAGVGIAGSPGGSGCRRTRCVAGCVGSVSGPGCCAAFYAVRGRA
jgi:hypothetical protein